MPSVRSWVTLFSSFSASVSSPQCTNVCKMPTQVGALMRVSWCCTVMSEIAGAVDQPHLNCFQ